MITQNTTPDGVVEATGGWLAPQDDGAEASDQLDVVRGHMTVEDVRRLLRERDGEVGVGVGVTGSITLCHALIGAGLVDEYRLFVFPRVLGGGRRLFPGGTDVRLTGTGSRTFRSGVTLLIHRRDRGRRAQRASTVCGTKKLRLSVISPSLSRMPRPAGSPSTTQAPRTGWCGPSTPVKSGSGANSWTTKPSVP